ncbi:mRNA splicing factor, thioredoxin-like U5 snRNP [Cynara cardunculus var. scolymus]|uniref:mRNA splicing factor, thioredoxin-like U5 snRNP n=1 Tax=Cynara cardunculus var. scolymus TaxID=59895 RepID=A0A103XLI3_CYNCS|nr:mRNA splicing factor, thioredoxin-like U5 snRNP [Cynara cardunculus var. scolymus]
MEVGCGHKRSHDCFLLFQEGAERFVERKREERCRTCYRTCTQAGPSIKPSSPRRNVSLSSASAMIGMKLVCSKGESERGTEENGGRDKAVALIYLVDITEVPDFNTMYELYDPSTIMFFFRNKHIMIDLGTGNNNKINWAMKDKQEFIDIVETVYRGARKGRGLVIAPKDYSTKYRY